MSPKCYSYIRFSSPEQEKGDSLRRQLQLSIDYAKENGLVLDDNLRMEDKGLSAYHGTHKAKGQLGHFLQLVEAGKIPKDSYLLVENLDRLSRQTPMEALVQFCNIIRAGIKIVTLCDRQEHDEQSIEKEPYKLFGSLAVMIRAHEESQRKAERLRAAWSSKRNQIQSKILTAKCPEWLKLNRDRTEFSVLEKRAEIVRRIYHMKLAGKGPRQIAIELNNNQTDWLPKSKRKSAKSGWHSSYIQKILNTRAVIGEFQPLTHIVRNGKKVREPAGEPLPNYYPAVVPLELFHAVRQQAEKNKKLHGNGGGRNGKISNLFGHIAVCGYCGSPMAYLNKGKPPKGAEYLLCDSARRSLPENTCKRNYIRYDKFEEVVLTHCKHLDPIKLLPGKDQIESELLERQSKETVISGQLNDVNAKIDNLTDSLATTSHNTIRKTVEEKLAQVIAEQETLLAQKSEIDAAIKELKMKTEDTESRLQSLRELLRYLKTKEGDELIDVRRQLRLELRSLIDRIEVFPVGLVQMTENHIAERLSAILDVQPELKSTKELYQIEKDLMAQIDNKSLRQYNVFFKGGSSLIIKPESEVKIPLEFDSDKKIVTHRYLADNKSVLEKILR